MAEGGTALLLQIIAIFLGGGSVQLIIAIVRRRAEMGEIDARTESLTSEISTKLNERLAEEVKRQSAKAEVLEERLELAKEKADIEIADLVYKLEQALATNKRLAADVARLRVDVTLANAQIEELIARLPK